MFSTPDRAQTAALCVGVAVAASTLLLSVLIHFSADLAWLCLTTTRAGGQSVAVLPGGGAERAAQADPNGEEALLPRAWSVPGWPSTVVIWASLPQDRALTRPPLLQPPAG